MVLQLRACQRSCGTNDCLRSKSQGLGKARLELRSGRYAQQMQCGTCESAVRETACRGGCIQPSSGEIRGQVVGDSWLTHLDAIQGTNLRPSRKSFITLGFHRAWWASIRPLGVMAGCRLKKKNGAGDVDGMMMGYLREAM